MRPDLTPSAPCARLAGLLALLLGGAAGALADDATPHPGYRSYVLGNAADVVTETSGLLVLQGGGDHVDANFIRMGERGGGGDFVVLRATGEDEYNSHIKGLCACDSVETLVVDSRAAASDPYVVATVRNAEALFIAGGDQSNYVRFWKDTPLEDAINHVASKPAPIGGTSAGMAIMGEFLYSAMTSESLTSAFALADPYAPDLTLDRGFLSLPKLQGVITDQHLQERDRIGRTVALLARLMKEGWTGNGRAIAADRRTSLHVDPESGRAEVFATADHATPHVYFMDADRPPEHCEAGEPLVFRDVAVYRLAPGGSFDLDDWRGTGGLAYRLSAEHGVLRSSRGATY